MSKVMLDSREIGALVELVNRERLGDAERKARALLTLHPEVGMLWKILGVALLRQGKDALQALRRTAELMPQDAEAHGNLGAALHDRGQWVEALESLRRALAGRPNDVDALVDAADALKALGRARDAVPLYQRALQFNPNLIEARNNLGNAFLELGDYGDAADCYRRALQINATDAQIHCNLGNALRQFGRLDEALISARRAIALDPALSIAYNNLGLILATLGQAEEAIVSYRQALTLNPGYVDALNNLGNMMRELAQPREALGLYARAAALEPGRAESHCNVGNMLFELRQIDEAVASYAQALTLRPEFTLAHVGLGAALRMLGRAADAEVAGRTALAIDPKSAEALSLLGELRSDRGRFAEAEELFLQAIAIDPGYTAAFSCIAAHRKMSVDDKAWLEGTEAALAKRLPLAAEVGLRFALGKYYDDVERWDDAFGNYRQANELTKRYGFRVDRDKLTQRVDRLIGGFDAARIRQFAAAGHASETPVFIVGMPRSGTSLAEQILASHPAVAGAGEITFWDAAYAACEAAENRREDGGELISTLAADYLARVSARLDGQSRAAESRVVDKMPRNFMYCGLIHAAFPKARIIHMQRHPLDTCLSIYFQNFYNMGPYDNDLDNLAYYYGEYVRITDHWRSVLPAATLLEVPYEALIEDQEGWSRRMLEFIGLPWDPRCLDFHETERVVLTASKWQVRQKIHAGSVGRWRNYEKCLGPLRRLAAPAG